MSNHRDLSAARRALSKELGSELIAELHRPNPWADAAVMILLPSTTIGLLVALAYLPFGVPWAFCFIAQGFAFQQYLFVSHDLFMHRRVGGRHNGWIGFLYFLPLLFSYSWFKAFHAQHHRYVGTSRDSEGYKQDLDTRWKRFLFLTAPGVKLLMARKLRPVQPSEPDDSGLIATPEERAQIALEQRILRVWWYSLLVASIFYRPLLFGWVLPFVLVTPIVSAIRVLLEHGEANPDNVFHTGTYHRSGVLTRILFSAGSIHVIHHIFQGIPFYRCTRAANLAHDALLRNGVVEQKSFVKLVVGFWIQNQPHRKLWRREASVEWTQDETATAPNPRLASSK